MALSPQELIQLSVSAAMALLSVGTFFIGRMTAKRSEGRDMGQLASDMGYLKSGIDDIKRRQAQQEKKEEGRHLEVMTRLTGVEASAKSAHKRIDRLEGKGCIA